MANPLVPDNDETYNSLQVACIEQIASSANFLRLIVEEKKKKGETSKDKNVEEDMDDLVALNQSLLVKERRCNDELEDARKELIVGLADILTDDTDIVIKRMGEIDIQPFKEACMKKFIYDEALDKASELCSMWQDNLQKSDWYPFKVVKVGGNYKEIVDEEDEMLKKLKEEWGVKVQRAVCKALAEMNEYNPSGRYVVSELWNAERERKATLKEVIGYMLQIMNKPRRKSRRTSCSSAQTTKQNRA